MPQMSYRNPLSRSALALLLFLFVAPRSLAQESDSLWRREPVPIGEVVVEGQRPSGALRPSLTQLHVIDRKQLAETRRTELLPALAEEVPGLFITARGVMGSGVSSGAAGGITLRGVGGSPTTGVLLLVDGHPQYSGLMGHPVADALRTSEIERVEVVRGPASVQYGSQAAGGVIHIVTRRARAEGFHGSVALSGGSYGTASLQNQITYRRKGFSFRAGGYHNRTDGHRANMDFRQWGGSTSLSLRLGKGWMLQGAAQLTRFESANPGSVEQPLEENDSRIVRGSADLALENRHERFAGALRFYLNWGRHHINDGHSPNEPPLAYRFLSHDRLWGLAWHQSCRIGAGTLLTLGVDFQYFGGETENRYTDRDRREPLADKAGNEAGIYGQIEQQVGSSLLLEAGVRYDRHSLAGAEWVPRAALSLDLGKGCSLKAILSKGFRFPTLRELFLFPSQNPDLRPERLWNYEMAFRHAGRVEYALTLFALQGENGIEVEYVDGRPRNVNSGRVSNLGMEAELSFPLTSHLRLRSNYSYLHMRHPRAATPEHKLFAALRYARSRWVVNSGLQMIRGLYTRTPAPTEELPRENYLLWSADVSFQAASWCQLWMRGENLLDSHYEINAGFPMPGLTLQSGVEFRF